MLRYDFSWDFVMLHTSNDADVIVSIKVIFEKFGFPLGSGPQIVKSSAEGFIDGTIDFVGRFVGFHKSL